METASVLPYEPKRRPAAPSPAAPTGDLAVTCRGVTKTYGDGSAGVTALRGVDLDVNAGELLMLVGPSGCGKTTLISTIAGILDQDEGECRVFGHDFKHMSQREKTRYRGETIGFVFQAFNLLPPLTAAENAAVPLLINGVKRPAALARAKEMLGRVGLGDRGNAKPSQLSGGQQQRVAIARAIVIEPPLVLMDEPLSNLDAKLRLEMRAEMRRIHNSLGATTIYVTHDQEEALSLADRIVVLQDGTIRQVGRPEELFSRPEHLDVADFIGFRNHLEGEVIAVQADTAELAV